MPTDLWRASMPSLAMPSGRSSARFASTNCAITSATTLQCSSFETAPQRCVVLRTCMQRKVVPMGGKVKEAFGRAPLLLGLLLLAACARPVERGATPAAVPAVAAAPGVDATRPPAAGVRRYRIDAARSLLTLRVFRGGALAAAGHNHVIASHDLEGLVDLAPRLERSAVSLRLPVARLAVDEPALRAGAGAEFAAEVPESAREGTRRNLLGAALLDAGRFPRIELDSTRVVAAPGRRHAHVARPRAGRRLQLRGARRPGDPGRGPGRERRGRTAPEPAGADPVQRDDGRPAGAGCDAGAVPARTRPALKEPLAGAPGQALGRALPAGQTPTREGSPACH